MSALSDALNEANVDRLSVREIARRGGDRVHHSALGKYLKPTHGRPSEDVLQVFSEVLRIPMPRLRQLAGVPAGEGEPYEPPREANRLDRRQRKLVDELIRMLVETKVGDGDVARDAASIGAWSDAVSAGDEQRVLIWGDRIADTLGVEIKKQLGTRVSEKIVRGAVRAALDSHEHPELYEDIAARDTTT